MKKSGKTCFTVITFFFLLYTLFPVFSAEPTEWKALIKKKYPQLQIGSDRETTIDVFDETEEMSKLRELFFRRL